MSDEQRTPDPDSPEQIHVRQFIDWLRGALIYGPRLIQSLRSEAARHGIDFDLFHDHPAVEAMGICKTEWRPSWKPTGGPQWWWSLPSEPEPEPDSRGELNHG